MLVLSRKENEELVIGENVRITIVRVAGNKVRLGISAPDFVSIRRCELNASPTAVACAAPDGSADRRQPARSQ